MQDLGHDRTGHVFTMSCAFLVAWRAKKASLQTKEPAAVIRQRAINQRTPGILPQMCGDGKAWGRLVRSPPQAEPGPPGP